MRTCRHKAYYSFEQEDGIEHSALFVSLSPCEIYERKVTMQKLHAAISSLPDKQAKRIYVHFVLGMSKTDIARAEGVDEKVVRLAIERWLYDVFSMFSKYRQSRC
ncbi:sigma-70 family RNA polymerase sigma factor [Parablautia intestinalis]